MPPCRCSVLFRYLDEQSFRFNNRGDNGSGRFVNVFKEVLVSRNRRGPRDGGSRVGSRRARHRGRVHEIGPAGAPVRSHAGMERLCRIVRGRMDQDALNVDDVFMGLRPRTAVGRAFATGRPRQRIIRARSLGLLSRMSCRPGSRRRIGARTCLSASVSWSTSRCMTRLPEPCLCQRCPAPLARPGARALSTPSSAR